jgi:hypothetical protein
MLFYSTILEVCLKSFVRCYVTYVFFMLEVITKILVACMVYLDASR